MGMSMQFVASRHGGNADYGNGYSNSPVKVTRLRAVAGQGKSPMTKIYDDINVGVNKEGKTDEHVWHKAISSEG